MSNNQINFIQAYNDPNSGTYNNALQSGLIAGYSREYSENITHLNPKWLSESIGNNEFLARALYNLEYFLDTKDSRLQSIRWQATKKVLDIFEKRILAKNYSKNSDSGLRSVKILTDEQKVRMDEIFSNFVV